MAFSEVICRIMLSWNVVDVFLPYWQFHYLNYGFWFCVSMRFLCVKVYLGVYMCFCAFYLAPFSMFIDFLFISSLCVLFIIIIL